MFAIQSDDDYKVIRCCFLLGQGSSVIEVRNLLMHKYQLPADRATAAINAALEHGNIERCDRYYASAVSFLSGPASCGFD
jgi:hypothetical protein